MRKATLIAAALASASICASAADIVFTTADDVATLQSVIESCHSGDRILLGDGLYQPEYTIYLTNGVTLVGSSFTNCIIKVSKNAPVRRVIYISGDESCISNIAITGGYLKPSVDHEQATGICMDGGVVSHCMISNNVITAGKLTHYGAGIYMTGGVVEYSIVAGNKQSASYSCGGGICMEGGEVRHSTIADNSNTGSTSCGGGVCLRGGTVTHCIITGNQAVSGGGICFGGYSIGLVSDALVDRCLIVGNTASGSYGGGVASRSSALVNNVQHKWTMRHTTVAKNQTSNTSNGSGGLYVQNKASVRSCESCIFADNSQLGGSNEGRPNWNSDASNAKKADLQALFHNCLFGNGSPEFGADSISGNAAFESLVNNDFHLTAASDAVDNALDSAYITDDLDGNAVTDGHPDIGCYELSLASAPFSAPIAYLADSHFQGATVSLSATVVNPPAGVTLRCIWTLTDGGTNTVTATGATTTATLNATGVYSVTLNVYNDATDALLLTVGGETTLPIYARVIYAYPGDDLPSIVNGLVDGQTLIVAEGAYNAADDIDIGANATILGAGRDKTVITFSAQDKGVKLHAQGAVVSGITIGSCRSSGNIDAVSITYGALLDSRITSCLVDNAVYGHAPLVVESGGLVERCIIDHNTNTTSRGFTSWVYTRAGAAAVSGTMRNCLVHHNYANTDPIVAIAIGGVVENCTIVDNLCTASSIEAVAVMLKGTAKIRNTVVVRNESPNFTTNVNQNGYALTGAMPTASPPNWAQRENTASASHNCWGESLETYGTYCADGSKISFINPDNGNWRIGVNSSCRDAGRLNADWMTADAIDLAGKPRVFHEIVDIGCYENQGSPSTVLMLQ